VTATSHQFAQLLSSCRASLRIWIGEEVPQRGVSERRKSVAIGRAAYRSRGLRHNGGPVGGARSHSYVAIDRTAWTYLARSPATCAAFSSEGSMRAAFYNEHGELAKLKLGERPNPEPGPGEVLVKTHAAAVGIRDVYMMKEGFGDPPLPKIPGSEVAGVVETVNDGSDFKPGDSVYGSLGFKSGGFAEYATTASDHLTRKPETISFEEAAALVIGAGTAYEGLVDPASVPAELDPDVWQNALQVNLEGTAATVRTACQHAAGLASGPSRAHPRASPGTACSARVPTRPPRRGLEGLVAVLNGRGGCRHLLQPRRPPSPSQKPTSLASRMTSARAFARGHPLAA
jgi:hypothetical protein